MSAAPPSDRSAAPLRRILSSNVISALTVCIVFGGLIVVGLYARDQRTALFRWAGFSGPSGTSGDAMGQTEAKGPSAARKAKLVGAASLDPNDPVLRFTETRMGQVLFTATGRDNCQRLLFDNRSGTYYESPEVFCGQTPEQVVEAETPERLKAVSKSMQR
jgi:hypothetical protein